MSVRLKNTLMLALVFALSSILNAQEVKVFDRSVQIHGFLSQGFAYSNQNNYLTMKTSDGSFAFTDMALNASTQITDKFRVGAQIYVPNFGELGNFYPQLDWAYGDYKFNSLLGIRVGKVKTVLGLYNDTQDAEFLHTWALLPQSVYPVDLRSATIAHTGGDVYGRISLKKGGKLDYTVYGGARSFDKRGGVYLFSEDAGIPIHSESGYSVGTDLRWTTPVKGLMVGTSWVKLTEDRKGVYAYDLQPGVMGLPYTLTANPDRIVAAYGDFERGRFHFNGEFRAEHYYGDVTTPVPSIPLFRYNGGNKTWFLSGAYRVSKWLQVGTYHSHYYCDVPFDPTNTASDHIFDQAATLRFDIKPWWNFKVEGHFMDGYGEVYRAHGFYSRSNPDGLKPTTNMLVVRTGVNF